MKRSTLAILLSVLVLVGVLVAVLVFGVIPYPEYASLIDQPDNSIPGTIAFVRSDDPPCAMTIPAGGGPATEVGCSWEMGGEGLAWTADGLLVTLDFTGSPAQYVLIDPASGEFVDRIDTALNGPEPLFKRPNATRLDGAVVTVGAMYTADRSNNGAVIWVSRQGAKATVLLEVDGPRDYRFETAIWSPDGNWILVSDSLDRLLIVRADGDPTPRILVEDVQPWNQSAWYIPGFDAFEVPGR